MRIMLDTNILVSIIFFPSGLTREFARQVGLGLTAKQLIYSV